MRRSGDLSNKFRLIIGLGDQKEGKMFAVGKIIDLGSYEEESVFKGCVQSKCMMQVKAEWDGLKGVNKAKFSLKFEREVEGGGDLEVEEILVMGAGGFEVKEDIEHGVQS